LENRESLFVRNDVYERDRQESARRLNELQGSMRTVIRFAATNIVVLIIAIVSGLIVGMLT